jgi:hypothetical protein
MGSQSGGGYASSPSGFKVLLHNIAGLAERYPMTPGGRFGKRGRNTRVIESDDPAATAREFWRALSKGGRQVPLPNGKGDRAMFDDDSLVVHRVRTGTPGSPAIEIVIATPGNGLPAYQKIHFLKKGAKR